MIQFVSKLALLATIKAATAADADGATTTITLGQDVDYPPYAFANPDGSLAGFGKDVADGMTNLCPDLEIIVVEERWSNCWSSDGGGSLGASVANGTLDGCMTYTHTQGVRDDLADFSDAILSDNKAAGLLTLLNEEGIPNVSGMGDLAGKKIIDVGGWAPTADGLGFVTNQCTDEKYSQDFELIVANGDVANDVAMTMLRNGTGDAIFIYADQARSYMQCTDGASWDCSLWKGFGSEYAYVQTGQLGYVVNGTTLALSRKGSGIREKLRPCMAEFVKTEEYYEICAKHDLVAGCYANEFFPADALTMDITRLPTKEQSGDCSDGYCPCDVAEAGDEAAALAPAADEGEVVDEVVAPIAEEGEVEETVEAPVSDEGEAVKVEAEELDSSGNASGHLAGISFGIIFGVFSMLV